MEFMSNEKRAKIMLRIKDKVNAYLLVFTDCPDRFEIDISKINEGIIDLRYCRCIVDSFFVSKNINESLSLEQIAEEQATIIYNRILKIEKIIQLTREADKENK